jgi:single-strand DNA-binding protein
MKGFTKALMVGALTQHSELRYTPDGLAILEMTVAGDQSINVEGQPLALPFYVRAKVFGSYAEALANDFRAGTVVGVDGRLNHRTWEDQEGRRRSALEVIVNSTNRMEGDFEFNQDAKGQPRLVGGVNSVSLAGNLVRDVDLITTTTGQQIARFTVAVEEKPSAKAKSTVHYIDVVAWRELATRAAHWKKGMPLWVKGRIVNESWEDQEGVKRYATRIEASHLFRAAAKPQQAQADAHAQPQQGPFTQEPEPGYPF